MKNVTFIIKLTLKNSMNEYKNYYKNGKNYLNHDILLR